MNKFLILSFVVLLTILAKATPVVHTASACLNVGNQVTLRCPSTNYHIDVKSVSYAHTPNNDCNNTVANNDCFQIR